MFLVHREVFLMQNFSIFTVWARFCHFPCFSGECIWLALLIYFLIAVITRLSFVSFKVKESSFWTILKNFVKSSCSHKIDGRYNSYFTTAWIGKHNYEVCFAHWITFYLVYWWYQWYNTIQQGWYHTHFIWSPFIWTLMVQMELWYSTDHIKYTKNVHLKLSNVKCAGHVTEENFVGSQNTCK